MKRIALIVLATALAFTTSLFGFVNTANAEDIQSCAAKVGTFHILNPGDEMTCTTNNDVRSFGWRTIIEDKEGTATLSVKSTTNPQPDCTNLNITLNSESETMMKECGISLETITFLNAPTSTSRVAVNMLIFPKSES